MVKWSSNTTLDTFAAINCNTVLCRNHRKDCMGIRWHCAQTVAHTDSPPLCVFLCALCVQLAALQTVSGSDAQAMAGVPNDAVLTAAVQFPPGSATKMESNIKAALDGDTESISMLRTMKLYLERMGADKQQVGMLAAFILFSVMSHLLCMILLRY